MIRQICSAVALAWFIVVPVPAFAFEPLATFLALAPGDLSIGHEVFSYTAPDRPFSGAETDSPIIWPEETMLQPALRDPEFARELTGIDFATANGVFTVGDTSTGVTIIQGAVGFAAGAAPVLEGRGYESSTVSGFRVFAIGTDYGMDAETVDNGDPLGGYVRRAHRVALADSFLVRAWGWPDMNVALAALAAPESCAGCLPWRALLTAIEGVSGEGATIEAATGFTMTVFMGPADPARFLLDLELTPEAREKLLAEMTSPTLALPPFGYAMIAATRAEGVATGHISLLFPTLEMAETGGAAVAERLKTQLAEYELSGKIPTHADIVITTGKAALGATATLSVHFGQDAPDGGVTHYLEWLSLIYMRQFYTLAFFQ